MSFCLKSGEEEADCIDFFLKEIKNMGIQTVILEERHSDDGQTNQSLMNSGIQMYSETTQDNNLDFEELDGIEKDKEKSNGKEDVAKSYKKLSSGFVSYKKKIFKVIFGLKYETECLKQQLTGLKQALQQQKKINEKLQKQLYTKFNSHIHFVVSQKSFLVGVSQKLMKQNQQFKQKNESLEAELKEIKSIINLQEENKEKQVEQGVSIKLRYLSTIQKFSKQIQLLEEHISMLKQNERAKNEEYRQKQSAVSDIEQELLKKEQEIIQRQKDLDEKEEQIYEGITMLTSKFEELRGIEESLMKKEEEIQMKINSYGKMKYGDGDRTIYERKACESPRNRIVKKSEISRIQFIKKGYQERPDFDTSPDRRLSLHEPFFNIKKPQYFQPISQPKQKFKTHKNLSMHSQNTNRLKTLGPHYNHDYSTYSKFSMQNRIADIQNNLEKQLNSLRYKTK